jgi:hypothetical protein
MQNLVQLGVRYAKLPSADRRYTSNGGVWLRRGHARDQVRSRVVLVQLCEDGSERLARVQFL